MCQGLLQHFDSECRFSGDSDIPLMPNWIKSHHKPAQTVITEDGVVATVDVLKIAESGTYIHVTWEFDESQKELYDKMSSEGGGNQVVFMALDDNNGNHFTTEDNMDTRQTIVFTVDGDDWSGAEQRKSYEADGKYYREMFGIIEGMKSGCHISDSNTLCEKQA